MKVADPGSQDLRRRVIEAKGRRDEHGIQCDHYGATHTVPFPPPSTVCMYRQQRAQQEQSHHCATAVRREQPCCNGLPLIALRPDFLPVHKQPHEPREEHESEGHVERPSKVPAKPQGSSSTANSLWSEPRHLNS